MQFRVKRRSQAFALLYVAPATLIYAVFVVWPLLQSFVLSFFRFRGVSSQRTFVGFDNFRQLWSDAAFWQSLRNSFWLFVIAGSVLLSAGVALAHVMQGKGRLTTAIRGIYLFPQVVSMVVVATLWMFLYKPNDGLVDSGLRAVGVKGPALGWLGDPALALPAVAVAFIWYALGFYVMLFSAGLKQIPDELNEAAELDGAIGWSKFWRLTWPMLWSVKRVAVVYILTNVINIFALVFLLTQGGPDRRTEVMLTYLYEQAFRNSQFGYATAMAVVNFLVAMAVSGLVLWWFRRNPEVSRA
ncbi:MAG: Lactose transport system permease protein LacF [Fimbriimonadaceae bacterium]|nr:Lactose transport system permease protein LacF [Fimbriimonadaceae bacterium]